MKDPTDFIYHHQGSVGLLQPLTENAGLWIEGNVATTPWFGNSLAIEWRYVDPIIEAIKYDGLEVTCDIS
jgi:hypothetical protein